nr:hypothetical protein 1 [Pelagibacterales bacterium]
MKTTQRLGLNKLESSDTADLTQFNPNWDDIDEKMVLEPFYLKSVSYDSTNDQINITFGPGRASFLGTLVAIGQDTVYTVSAPVANTDYYIFIKDDGTFTHNTDSSEISGAVLIRKISTGSTVDSITEVDLRGVLPGAAAQTVKDQLDTHKSATDPHPQYAKDGDPPTAHASTHAAGGSDAIAPADIGAETPSGAQTKADQAETDAINWAKGYGLGSVAKTITDWNNAVYTGSYQGNNALNQPPKPTGANDWVKGWVVRHNEYWIDQYVQDFNGKGLYFRRSHGNATDGTIWDPWQQIFGDNNLGANAGNATIQEIQAMLSETHTRKVDLIYDANGEVSSIDELDGTTVMRTTTINKDANGKITSIDQVVNGKTITSTFNYDASGNLDTITRSVV